MTNQERADRFYQLEQSARQKMRRRTEYLYEKARRQIDLRIGHYPKSMQKGYQAYVEQLYLDLCNEDLRLQALDTQQKNCLQLAQAYEIRAREVVAA